MAADFVSRHFQYTMYYFFFLLSNAFRMPVLAMMMIIATKSPNIPVPMISRPIPILFIICLLRSHYINWVTNWISIPPAIAEAT